MPPFVVSIGVIYTCFYTLPVTDAAAAPTSSSQPTTTTQLQTDENPSSLVVGMLLYIVTIIPRYVEMMARHTVMFMYF